MNGFISYQDGSTNVQYSGLFHDLVYILDITTAQAYYTFSFNLVNVYERKKKKIPGDLKEGCDQGRSNSVVRLQEGLDFLEESDQAYTGCREQLTKNCRLYILAENFQNIGVAEFLP